MIEQSRIDVALVLEGNLSVQMGPITKEMRAFSEASKAARDAMKAPTDSIGTFIRSSNGIDLAAQAMHRFAEAAK